MNNNNTPFHNPQANPHPDAQDIEQEINQHSSTQQAFLQSETSADRQKLKRLFLGLLGIGLVLGLITATGIIWFLGRLDMIGVPETPPTQELQQ